MKPFTRVAPTATLTAALAATLTACTLTPKSGTEVALREVLDTHAGQYECLDYQAASDSCKALGRSVVYGDDVITTSLFAFDEGLPAQIKVVSRHKLEGAALCGLTAPIKITVTSQGTPRANQAIKELFAKTFNDSIPNLCTRYYRDGSGDRYINITTDLQGTPVPDSAVKARFFDEQKNLRITKL
ncbi:hypothetical protein KO498_08100 [Lentibacter algarum]|uniref:hypothetical protein n=1 Tax=Lentibacter algarum TaxID=576131 RepID=UPI001C067209|nr:hypothetical protein [Lentibacter algarum]MBU2981776.1 hypothetical protein [Lentibacter algarum]